MRSQVPSGRKEPGVWFLAIKVGSAPAFSMLSALFTKAGAGRRDLNCNHATYLIKVDGRNSHKSLEKGILGDAVDVKEGFGCAREACQTTPKIITLATAGRPPFDLFEALRMEHTCDGEKL